MSVIGIKNPWIRRTILILTVVPTMVLCIGVGMIQGPISLVLEMLGSFVNTWRGR